MRLITSILTILLIFPIEVFTQDNLKDHQSEIEISDFSGTLSILASDWMEGREAGAKGSFMAADYIASMMENYGLKPFGDLVSGKVFVDPKNPVKIPMHRIYFQDFRIIRYKPVKSALSLIKKSNSSETCVSLVPEKDFRPLEVANSQKGEAQLVFTGYGLTLPQVGYDDYKNIDVKGKIVIVLAGFPGHKDTTSFAWSKLPKTDHNKISDLNTKIKTAKNLGAVAVIEVITSKNAKYFSEKPVNEHLLKSAMNSDKQVDPDYIDDNYRLPSDTLLPQIPCFIFSSQTSSDFLTDTGIDLSDFELQAAKKLISNSKLINEKIVGYSVEVISEPVMVRNVIGMIPGADTTKSMVIGAHYDHNGTRNGLIYNGADDNASGVAGMLALAKYWSESKEKAAVNLIFAAWTAEEKGILGSSYFVESQTVNNVNFLLNLNFDMISRSATEDTARIQLSIGTLKGSEKLKEIAKANNNQLKKPFQLDLWEASENGGSDYVPFAAKKIPIMTFFSGFHDDYHSPRDISTKADLNKMLFVLRLANNCLIQIMK